MPSIYIVNFAGHDYSEAQQFGDLVVLTEGNVRTDRFDRTLYSLTRKLRESTPDDYLLPSGALLLNVMATTVMYHLHGSVRALIWDGQTYQTLTITESHLDFLAECIDSPDIWTF